MKKQMKKTYFAVCEKGASPSIGKKIDCYRLRVDQSPYFEFVTTSVVIEITYDAYIMRAETLNSVYIFLRDNEKAPNAFFVLLNKKPRWGKPLNGFAVSMKDGELIATQLNEEAEQIEKFADYYKIGIDVQVCYAKIM